MSKDITNIANWKNKYSFLSNVLKTYDEFDSNGDIYTNQHKYLPVCKLFMSRLSGNMNNHENFCMKLLRNLGHYDVGTNFFDPSHARCHILYNWIYNTIKNSNIPNELIIQCFEDYIENINKMKNTYKCSYGLFNTTYLEPSKITILKIFDNNIHDIFVKLNEEHSLTDSPSQNYVCECVKLYKEIEKKHCTNITGKNYKRDQTCEMLNTFKRSYMEYIYNKVVKKDKIPSLENVESEYMRKCSKNRDLSALASSDGDSAPQFAQSTTTVRGNSDASQTTEGINEGDRANSLSPIVSTALGTVAGASSLLALLYKFTPGRNWIRSGFKGGRGRINSNLYAEGPSELLFDGMEHNDFNSYSIGYEAI